MFNNSWQPRNKNKFAKKFAEDKRLRSMRLTDEAWDGLENAANECGLSRTDLLEVLGRNGGFHSIVLNAIDIYLLACEKAHKENPTKQGTEFSTNTRDYTHLLRFRKCVENGELLDPVALLKDELE